MHHPMGVERRTNSREERCLSKCRRRPKVHARASRETFKPTSNPEVGV